MTPVERRGSGFSRDLIGPEGPAGLTSALSACGGFSYLEILVAIVIIALSVPAALQAMRIGIDSTRAQERSLGLTQRAAGEMETVLAEPFASLRAAAASARSSTVPTSYSEPSGTADRLLVYLSLYDAADGDGDRNPFTILDPNTDGDANPYTGTSPHIALLWVRVQVEGTNVAFTTLTSE
jgi:type II secretory pathway pseudopilin PulG